MLILHYGFSSLNEILFTKLKAKVIAGAANNQFADENVHGAIYRKRDFYMHLIS
jgi:glutamate dehydrogenase/leucine dehydrogenase